MKLVEIAERLREISHDSKDARELREAIEILADNLYAEAEESGVHVVLNPGDGFVKVYETEYPDEGCTYITKEDYESNKEMWTLV